MTYKSADPSRNQLMTHVYMLATFTDFAGNEVGLIFVAVTFCTEVETLSECFFYLLYIYIIANIIISSILSVLILLIGKKNLQSLSLICCLLIPSRGFLLLSCRIFLLCLTESFTLIKLLQKLRTKKNQSANHWRHNKVFC